MTDRAENPTMLTVEEVRTADRLASLAPSWERLLEAGEGCTPFLTPDWVRLCAGCFGEGKRLRVLGVSAGGQLVGLAPFWIARGRARGIRLRRLSFVRGPDSPFVDLVARRDLRDEVAGAVLDHLTGPLAREWDVVELESWPAGSPQLEAVVRVLGRRRVSFLLRASTVLPYLAIEGSWDDFLRSRSAKYRKTARNVANRMQRLGDVVVERHSSDPGDLVPIVAAISEKSWKHERGVALSSSAETREFFEGLTAVASRRGWLLAWVLRASGRPIAMEYDLVWNGVAYALRSDFDEGYRDYSPGAYLQTEILKYLFERGYASYNTGPGLNEYKLHTTNRELECRRLSLFGSGVRGRLLAGLEEKLLPVARSIRDSIGGRGGSGE